MDCTHNLCQRKWFPEHDVEATGDAIRYDVARFAAGVEAADDIAILVLQWKGV